MDENKKGMLIAIALVGGLIGLVLAMMVDLAIGCVVIMIIMSIMGMSILPTIPMKEQK
jgi:hypothetical protein